MIDLFYMNDARYGGFVSYTAHLWRALNAQGKTARVFKVAKKLERKQREYTHGIAYQNVPLGYAIESARAGRAVITCAYWKHNPIAVGALLKHGAAIVVHDPTELSVELVECIRETGARVIAIREGNVDKFRELGVESVFVPHPYVSPGAGKNQGLKHACSLSRIDFDKHIDIIVEANMMLEPYLRVDIWGAPNRIYVHHKLQPKFGSHWTQDYCGDFPREARSAITIAGRYKYVVDMSLIAGDGGGTQYTFFEAWDAGCRLVVHRGWLREGGEMREGFNCYAAGDAEELTRVLLQTGDDRTRFGGRDALLGHSPKAIVPRFLEALR